MKISQMSNGEVSSDKNHPLLFKLYTKLRGIQGMWFHGNVAPQVSTRTYADFLGQNACSTRDSGGLTLFRPTDAWLVRSGEGRAGGSRGFSNFQGTLLVEMCLYLDGYRVYPSYTHLQPWLFIGFDGVITTL